MPLSDKQLKKDLKVMLEADRRHLDAAIRERNNAEARRKIASIEALKRELSK